MTVSAAAGGAFAGFGAGDAPDYDILNTCVQCGLCLPTCPTYRTVYREQSSPRGRLHLMKSVHEGRLDVLDPTFVDQMGECLSCRACEAVCPSGVAFGAVHEAARAQIEQAREQRAARPPAETALRRAVFDGVFARPALFRLVARLTAVYQRSGLRGVVRRTPLLSWLGLQSLEAQLPPMPRSFIVPEGQVYPGAGERRGRAGLLTGCVMSTAYAPTTRATIRVLRQNGWEVVLAAGQTCCGALHVHAGDPDGGRARARTVIAAFERAGVDVVVVNAAGCGAAMKEYGHLLAGEAAWADRARAFSARVSDVTELLAAAPLRPGLGSLERTVTYQEPCHLAHAQRITAPPRALLRQIPGLRLVEMAEASLCCGSAGIYSVTRPEMSAALLERKLDHALATAADTIATANPGCMMQLRAGLDASGRGDVTVTHVVDLVDASYRRGLGGPRHGVARVR